MNGKWFNYEQGNMIYKAGDESKYIYIIESGEVEICKRINYYEDSVSLK